MRSIPAVITMLCCSAVLYAAGVPDSDAAGDPLSISGKLEFGIAEMLKARTSSGGSNTPGPSATVDHIWFGHTIGTLTLESKPVDLLTVRASFEFRQYMTTLPIIKDVYRDQFFGQYYWNGFYIREGQGVFSLLKESPLSLDVAFGYMPYKYNPDARNLGEFLFRTGTYPLYILGEFDRPFARLTGLRAGLGFSNEALTAKLDLLAMLEREHRPFNDLSLGAVAGVTALNMIDIGCGVDLMHQVPVDSRLNELEDADNRYFTDSTQSETGYYSFKGTKIMARASLDPFGILRGGNSFMDEILGESGGKVYAEYAIIGLKNYPADPINNPWGYEKRSERSPWMVGVAFPMWKILDQCSFELERFPAYTPDGYWNPVIRGFPLPTSRTKSASYDSTVYVPRWNWSVYVKRRIVEHFTLIGQAGRDHQRWEFHSAQLVSYDFETAMVRPDEWGWRLFGVFTF